MVDLKTELSITLAAGEWDQVLDVLGDGRFKVVSPLIKKILDQAKQQTEPEGEIERARLHPVN